MNSAEVVGRQTREILGLVQGHTVFAIWLGKDLSAVVRFVLGGELTEYTEMMGRARTVVPHRMVAQAAQMQGDAIVQFFSMNVSPQGQWPLGVDQVRS